MDDGFAVGEVPQYFVHLVADSRAQVTPGRVVLTNPPEGAERVPMGFCYSL